MSKTSVMWFRRDLRIKDNFALSAAVSNSERVTLIFIIDPKQITLNHSANQSSFFASLLNFKSVLAKEKVNLYILKGNVLDVFKVLKKVIPDWQNLYFNSDEHGYGKKRDQMVEKYCRDELHVNSHQFCDFTLHSAFDIKKKDGTFYKVFTPYFKQWIQYPKQKPVLAPKLTQISKKQISPKFKDRTDELKKLIFKGDYVFERQLGESSANLALTNFISHSLKNYERTRDIPSINGTSHLSRFLRTGEISIRTIYEAVIQEPEGNGRSTFIKELCWRDFYNMIYAMYPSQQEEAIKNDFKNISWRNNKDDFKAWATGKTGFPIVDAAMRQLNETGWMHNRLRMIVSSFLTKDLLIDWRLGEAYFRQQLIDYDPASNIGGWQWAASTGTDSVPYFRVFNPTIQSKKFDPEAVFIKRYVPEVRYIKGDKIHDPSQLTEIEQKEYKIILGKDYPEPIVNHKTARLRAIAAYKSSKHDSRLHQ